MSVAREVADPIVAWLREQDHDVRHARETAPVAGDERWIEAAEAEGRVLLNSDKDFGDLVFRDHLATCGVVLLRLDAMTIRQRIIRLAAVWPQIESEGVGKILVVTHSKVRVRDLSDP